MKKIDKLILMDFIPPYLMAFFVAEFVLVMQFLWKYIDEMIGKGISFGVLMELLFYFGVRIIPEAVPVTILIASVMVFGNLAEKHEITSMKSAGISLTRIMSAGILISIFTAMFSLLASNYLKPRANYKFLQRLYSVKKQDATLNLQEGVFSYDFKNITINVGKKLKDGQRIENVLIYDNSSQDKSQINMLSAQKGKMYVNETNLFVMDLENGEQYRDIKSAKRKSSTTFVRTKFEKWTKHFDMSEFNMEATDLTNSGKKYDMLNAWQLKSAVDSFSTEIEDKVKSNAYNFEQILQISEVEKEKPNKTKNIPKSVTDAIKKTDKQVKENKKKSKSKTKTKLKKKLAKKQLDNIDLNNAGSLLATFIKKDAKSIIKTSKYLTGKKGDSVKKIAREKRNIKKKKAVYTLKLHQQFSFALVCIVFLFIGAPLGSIVRKGGYGYPLLIAIIFFMIFIVLNIMGEKINRTGEINPVVAAWLPNIVLIPVAIYITKKALSDSDFNSVGNFFKGLIAKIRRNASPS